MPGFRANAHGAIWENLQQLTLKSCRKPPVLPQPPANACDISRKHWEHSEACLSRLQTKNRVSL